MLRRCSNSAHAALHPSLRSTAQSFEQGDLAASEAWIYHESWNFPAGVSFALKQNMYWGGFCAFLPDISCLGGGGGGGGCFLFLLFWGTPKDMDLRNAYMYSLPRHFTV